MVVSVHGQWCHLIIGLLYEILFLEILENEKKKGKILSYVCSFQLFMW
uniref:Uncharacterized protein n=1 Tax=Rhizophora mucronata TaxID=61149 RepID=A0A2P2IIQ1_RHIMU